MTGRQTILAIAASVLIPAALAAQGRTVSLVVTDSVGNPIPYAAVSGGASQWVTDRSGEARIPRVQPGAVKLRVRRIGFSPAMVTTIGDRDTTIHVVMAPIATMLEAQQVTARANSPLERTGFYDRMRDRERGLVTGYFILPEDIDQRKPTQISHMLYDVPSVRIEYITRGNIGAVPRGPDGCAMTIYLDGSRLQTAFTGMVGGSSKFSRGGGVSPLSGIDQIISAATITAVEVYPRGSRAPAMYQLLNGTCGIIAFWSKA